MKIITKYFCFLVAFFALFFVFNVSQAKAATLYFSPSSGNFSVGNILTTSVFVNTGGQTINNADAVINFPTGLLDVVSVSKSGSIFSLWIEEPAFSNSTGAITFNGGLPTPGFSGTAGKIVNIVFRVKSAGSASLIFSSGSVRANDGEGTNILSGFGGATFSLVDGGAKPATPIVEAPKPSSVPAPVPPPDTDGSTPTPKISSATHPDQSKWYANNSARLSWPVPSGVTALRLLLSSSPNDTPTITYIPPINSKDLPNLDDGVYYFSARFKDAKGWGEVARYTLRIDTKPPTEFTIGLPDGELTTKTQPRLRLATMDMTSGLDYWLIKINDETPLTVRPEDIINELYTLPPQNPGVKNIAVEAYDKAGNKTVATAKMEIQGEMKGKNIALTSWPEKVTTGANIIIKGKTSGQNQITVYWQKDNEPAMANGVVSDASGNFTFITRALIAGDYHAWASIKDSDGLITASSDKIIIAVRESLATLVFNILKQVWWLLIILALGGLVFLYFKYPLARERDGKDQDINRALYNSLHLLRDGIKAQIIILTAAKARRRLSREETAVMIGLQKTLSNTDRFLAKEITIIKKRRKPRQKR